MVSCCGRCFVHYCENYSMVVFSLTLARHGETEHNKNNVIQGQLDIPLSTIGLQQAKTLGIHLKHQQYTKIYVSDLVRAKQTADAIIKQNLSFKGQSIQDTRLRERKFGNIEGKNFKYLKKAAENAGQKIGDYTPPDGETLKQVYGRVVSFFQDLCQTIANNYLQNDETIKDSILMGMNHCSIQHNGNSINNCSPQKVVPSCSHTLPVIDNKSAMGEIRCQHKECTNVPSTSIDEDLNRKKSICDADKNSELKGEIDENVLIVTHGGFIRELLRYFVEEFNCSIPGGKQQALRITPNAAVSKFTITVEENGENPKITCHQIHGKEYVNCKIVKNISVNSIDNTAL